MTAAENIGLGDLPALGDAARLKEAAVRAGVHETLFELPRGYDTLLTRIFFAEADKGNTKIKPGSVDAETDNALLLRANGCQTARAMQMRAFSRGPAS
ncbi:hypothetical protein [Nonomuraea sp. NPDC049028]|uniref:hypothetical protein n=1 Tax=Nonomuraea sp. NPDC049028 TaxID=3364348 RepID=UPI0037229695